MADLDFIGPFERHEVVLNGRLVPHLNATPVEGGIHLNLDDRLGLDLSHDEALRFIPSNWNLTPLRSSPSACSIPTHFGSVQCSATNLLSRHGQQHIQSDT
jgi:hypothetical protein